MMAGKDRGFRNNLADPISFHAAAYLPRDYIRSTVHIKHVSVGRRRVLLLVTIVRTYWKGGKGRRFGKYCISSHPRIFLLSISGESLREKVASTPRPSSLDPRPPPLPPPRRRTTVLQHHIPSKPSHCPCSNSVLIRVSPHHPHQSMDPGDDIIDVLYRYRDLAHYSR